jgi:hypothetical protein
MSDGEFVPLVDTTREELRARIGLAGWRFVDVVRGADPASRPRGSQWNVQQITAHVLTVARRYRDVAHGNDFHRAAYPAELPLINRAELDAAMAPMGDLTAELRDLEGELAAFFDAVCDDGPRYPSHAGAVLDGVTLQTNWLGELLLHGSDVARAGKESWEVCERDMLLIARGLMQFGPAFLRRGTPTDTHLSVAFHLPQARPYLILIGDGAAQFRPRRADDRPDAVLRAPASTFASLLYQRIGPLTAARRGLLITGGRRPWVALTLQSCFEPP